mmetsp:Transcript_40071/g.107436  ORF Transcript_40071/g.107436 Transcript_40071/m.107436 type:complete len:170 (+) Transcript_40071:127-636(+)
MEGKYAEEGEGKYDDEKGGDEKASEAGTRGAAAEEEDESDMGGELPEKTRLFERVKNFCMSQGFEKDFEDFAERHHEHFMDAIDMVQGDEHKLEHHNIYNQYLEEFEGKIAKCIENEGGSVHDFYEEAQRIIESDDMSTNKFFIEALLATTDYGVFMTLMRGEARKFRK